LYLSHSQHLIAAGAQNSQSKYARLAEGQELFAAGYFEAAERITRRICICGRCEKLLVQWSVDDDVHVLNPRVVVDGAGQQPLGLAAQRVRTTDGAERCWCCHWWRWIHPDGAVRESTSRLDEQEASSSRLHHAAQLHLAFFTRRHYDDEFLEAWMFHLHLHGIRWFY